MKVFIPGSVSKERIGAEAFNPGIHRKGHRMSSQSCIEASSKVGHNCLSKAGSTERIMIFQMARISATDHHQRLQSHLAGDKKVNLMPLGYLRAPQGHLSHELMISPSNALSGIAWQVPDIASIWSDSITALEHTRVVSAIPVKIRTEAAAELKLLT